MEVEKLSSFLDINFFKSSHLMDHFESEEENVNFVMEDIKSEALYAMIDNVSQTSFLCFFLLYNFLQLIYIIFLCYADF